MLRKGLNLVGVESNKEALMGMDRYEMCKCVGVGGFSKVYLARDKLDGAFYAAKCVDKVSLGDKEYLILNERDLNRRLDSPLLVRMHQFI